MTGRGAALVRALGALVFTAALVVGVPALLVATVGNPFPAELPTLNEMRILLTQNGQGFTNFLIGTLAVLIWVLWAQLVVALVVEVSATLRQTETRRLRIAPGLQRFAARLVAAITLATLLATGPLVAPAVGALSFNDVTSALPGPGFVVDVRSVTAGASSGGVNGTTTPAAAGSEAAAPIGGASAVAMVVAEHTELWDLADAAYGDGVSWKLIALANTGAFDATGVPITADTESVSPGTELVLPGVADGRQVSSFGSILAGGAGTAPSAAPLDVASHEQQVEPGDSMWTMAEDHVAQRLGRAGTEAEVAEYWTDVVASNQDVQSGNVDLIYPGEILEFPGAELAPSAPDDQVAPTADDRTPEVSGTSEAAFVVADGPVDTRSTPSMPAQAVRETEPPSPALTPAPTVADAPQLQQVDVANTLAASSKADTSASGASRAPAVGLVALGTAMLSAGVVSAVRRRRDAQRRTRPAGTMARAPSSEAAAFEAAIVHSSHELKESTQGLGWRALPASAVAGLRPDGPIEVHASPGGELIAVAICASSDERPVQVAPDTDKAFEEAPRRDVIRADVARTSTEEQPNEQPVPTVEPLAPLPTASIIVGTEMSNGDAILLDLRAGTTVALQGSAEGVRRFVRGVVLDLAVSERVDDICVVAVGVGDELDELERVHVVTDYAEALAHIVRTGHGVVDDPTPVVIASAVGNSAPDDSVQKLLACGATILGPGLESTASIAIEGEQATIAPSGTIAQLAAFDDDEYRAVSELIGTTSSTSIELVDPTVQINDVLDVAATSECVVESGAIELKILGPVEVSGAASFSSLKAVDVIAYLAFHRHGVDADQIKTWVWPPFDPPTDKAFANVMSRARTGLGADETGEPYLSRAGADKTYRLSAAVTTDFDRVRAIGELADQADEDESTLRLFKQAVELIRGVPFTGGAASSFAWADNHVRAQVEYTIDELVHRCADLAIDLGDLATARWAALKGLELVPGCEQCFRRRFLIAGAGNNRSELRRAMADLEAAAMVDLGEPEAVDSISGELLDLYNELDRALVAGTV